MSTDHQTPLKQCWKQQNSECKLYDNMLSAGVTYFEKSARARARRILQPPDNDLQHKAP